VPGYEPTSRVNDPADVAFVRHQVADIRRRLQTFDPGPSGWGIIHADPQVLNIHFTDDDQITIFDFDLCAYGWRAYDLAYYYTRIPEHLRASAIDGYQSIRLLTQAEHDMLPTLGRAAWIWEGLQSQNLIARLTNPYLP
jgi:homoserine kinase type II